MNLWEFARALVGFPGGDAGDGGDAQDERVVDLARAAEFEAARARRNRARLEALRAQRRVLARTRADEGGRRG